MSTSTTLITFLLRAPEGTFAVELLGSWDNFSKPYKLNRDRRTGDNNWRGCHFFEGITCDGDTSDLSEMRNGGLKMGGTYWYFYRLNSETEYHDPAEPYTSSCPLLPGQPVNVLDMPMQTPKTYSGSDSSDSLDSLVFTLDPRDKYLPPGVRRARTTSAIQQRKTFLPKTPRVPLTTRKSDLTESHQPQTPNSTRDGPTLRPQRSLISIFDKLRRTKSAGSNTNRATTSWHRKVFSRAGSRSGSRADSSENAISPDDVPAVPEVPAHILAKSKSNIARAMPPSLDQPAVLATTDPVVSLGAATDGLSLAPGSNDQIHGGTVILTTSLQGKFGAPSKPRCVAPSVSEPAMWNEYNSKSESHYPHMSETIALPNECTLNSVFQAAAATLRSSPPEGQAPAADEVCDEICLSLPGQEYGLSKHGDPALGFSCADSSYATDDNFSPNLVSKSTQSGPMSPMQLSQPETPVMSDFGDDAASWTRGSDSLDLDIINMRPPSRAPPSPPPSSLPPAFSNPFRIQAPLSGFQGYRLPRGDQGSMHTIRKLPSMTSVRPEHPLHHQTSSKDLVHSWNDGSEHRMTALEELVDDLGYLGAFIV